MKSALLLYFDDGSDMAQYNTRTANDVYNALLSRGYEAHLFQVTQENLFEAITMPGEVVFNFAEDPTYDLYKKVVRWSGKLDRPCFRSMKNFQFEANKNNVQRKLTAHGLPCPKSITVSNLDFQVDLQYPLIIKPVKCHSSIGITQKSVVENEKQLRRRVRQTLNQLGPALIEEFIIGREINVTLLGNNDNVFTLPYREVFLTGNCNKWKIYSHDTKWAALAGKESCETGVEIVSSPDIPHKHKIDRTIIEAYKVLGFRDNARIDFKLTDNGDIYIFDTASGPSISTINDYNADHWTYEDFIEVLMGICHERVHGEMPHKAKSLIGIYEQTNSPRN